MHRFSACLIIVLVWALTSSMPEIAQSPAEAVETATAKAYLDSLKSGRVTEAVNQFWDVDMLLAGSFGLMYLDLSADEKRAAQQAFAHFVAAPFASPKLARLFSAIEIRNTKARAISESLVAVTLEIAGDTGRFNASNTMLVCKVGDAWRIVDQRQGSQMPIRVSVVAMWLQERRQPGDSIAAVMERAASEVQRQAAAK